MFRTPWRANFLSPFKSLKCLCTPLIPVFEKQRQEDLCELEASVIYTGGSGTARATKRPCIQNNPHDLQLINNENVMHIHNEIMKSAVNDGTTQNSILTEVIQEWKNQCSLSSVVPSLNLHIT